ncbi:MAG: hypothetical protein U0324_32910 [Polyangiales bacterium]
MRPSIAALLLAACDAAPPAAQTPDVPSEPAPTVDAAPLDVAPLDIPPPDAAQPDDVPSPDASPPQRDARPDDRAAEPERSVRVAPGPTDDAELLRLLPIGTSAASAPRRVVLRLGPDDLPSLREGDVLMAPAEVQVTTACDVGQAGPACGYGPQVAAQLILTGDRDDRDPDGPESRALSDVTRTTVTSAEHHVTMAFRAGASRATLSGGFALPCLADGRCHVNLVMWAWDAQARPGGADALLVGENEGDYLANGVVQGDKARIMAVRERNLRADDRVEREVTGGGAVDMPLDARDVLIYSLPIAGDAGFARGEQYYVEARAVVRVTGRARFSTQLFLARDPRATDPRSLDGVFPGAISEHNGGNCTTGTSPCTTNRVAVFRASDDVRGPVYVQLIARSAVPGGGSASVTVDRGGGWLRATRYAASLY